MELPAEGQVCCVVIHHRRRVSLDKVKIVIERKPLDGSLTINVYDATAQGVFGGGFPSVDDFKTAVRDYVDQIIRANPGGGPLSTMLPFWVASRALPDHWQRVQNMTLRFLGFRHKMVQIHGRPISYLFVVFSIQSMGLPPHCFCEESPTLAKGSGDDKKPLQDGS